MAIRVTQESEFRQSKERKLPFLFVLRCHCPSCLRKCRPHSYHPAVAMQVPCFELTLATVGVNVEWDVSVSAYERTTEENHEYLAWWWMGITPILGRKSDLLVSSSMDVLQLTPTFSPYGPNYPLFRMKTICWHTSAGVSKVCELRNCSSADSRGRKPHPITCHTMWHEYIWQ